MSTPSLAQRRPARDFAHLKPLPDPPLLPDAMLQYRHLTRADQTLATWFRQRSDALVGGQGYLCFNRTDPRNTWLAPDCVVALGIDPEHATVSNSYIINEVGKPPDFVMEVATESTGWRDYTVKPDQYAAFGVGEYWRFDPSGGEYYDRSLAGDLLSAAGRYEPLDIHTDADGMLWGHSPLLGLDLCWRDGELFFRNPANGEFLLRPAQVQDALEATRDELIATQDVLAVSETRAVNAEALAAVAETRAANSETRAANAEAEAERLRAILRRLQPDADADTDAADTTEPPA